MNNKVIRAINSMISNSKKITNVHRTGQEYFFLYDNKYKWSVRKHKDKEDYFLHYYDLPNYSISEIASFDNWSDVSGFVTFKTEDYKTQEALESFTELYNIVAGKVFGIDEVLNDIINE